MWKRLVPAILMIALAPSAADAFTMGETTATMGAHQAAAGSGGTSWTSAIGQTRSALRSSGSTARGGAANGKGWSSGSSKSSGSAKGSNTWATGRATQSARR